jgi:hypothetical protein
MTPSRETKTAPVSLRIGRLALERSFDLGDVNLLHFLHRIERALGRRLVAVRRGFQQDPGCDLPGEAPLVLAPAALAFLAAIVDDGVPVTISLSLVLGHDHEADGFVGLEVRAAVQA